MKRRGRFSPLFLLAAFFLMFSSLNYDFAQQDASQAEDKVIQVGKEEKQEKIIPSPSNIKESTAIYVFLVWMWAAMFVLIYILRLKIKEVDRLYRIKFFSSKRE